MAGPAQRPGAQAVAADEGDVVAVEVSWPNLRGGGGGGGVGVTVEVGGAVGEGDGDGEGVAVAVGPPDCHCP
jgi:hypothetical protein